MSHADKTALSQWTAHRDAIAFRDIVARHSPMVYATCRRVLNDATEAEDVTQECFEALATARNEPSEYLGPWLHRVATNLAFKRIRSDKRRRLRELTFAERQPGHTEIAWDDVYAYVDEALLDLPEKFRVPIIAHFLQGDTQTDIARSLGLSPQTVAYRIRTGLDRLGKGLRRRGIKVGAAALAGMLAAEGSSAAPVSPSLTAALGNLALAHTSNSTGAMAAATLPGMLGGILVMKKLVVVSVLVLAAALVWWTVRERPQSPAVPPPESSEAQVEVGEDAIALSLESKAPLQIPEPKGGAVSGRVYDADTGRGIAGVILSAEASGGVRDRVSSDPSGSDGAYQIEGLRGNSYAIARTNTPAGYQRPRQSERYALTFDADQKVGSVDIPLRHEVPLAGIVVDSGGNPVPLAKVLLNGGSDYMVSASETTNENGRFSFHQLGATDRLNLQAETDDGKISPLVTFALPEAGLTDLRLKLEAASRISGMVLDANGTPLPEVEVIAQPSQNDRANINQVVSDRSGRYAFDGLAAGSYVLNLPEWYEGERDARRSNVAVDLPAAQELSDLNLRLDRGTLSISGRVIYADGRPIAEANVLCGGEQIQTGADGRYVFTGLEDAAYEVHAWKMKEPKTGLVVFSADRPFVRAGSENIDFVVQDHVLTVQVLDATTSEPIRDFEYGMINSWRNALDSSFSDELYQRVMEPEGRVEINRTRPDRYLLAFRATGYATATRVILLNESNLNQDLVVRLEQGGDLHGIVRDRQGNGISKAHVYYDMPNTNMAPTAITSSNGTFTLPSFPKEAQLVSISHPDYAPAFVEVPAGADLEHPLVVTLDAGGALEGTVSLPDSILWERCAVYVRYPQSDTTPCYTKLGRGGTFHLSHLPLGKATAQLLIHSGGRDRQGRYLEQPVTIAAGETSEVRFDVYEAEGVLEGTLLMENLNDIHYANVRLYLTTSQGTDQFTAPIDNEGRYRLTGLPAGIGTLQVTLVPASTREPLEASMPIELAEGEATYQDLDASQLLR